MKGLFLLVIVLKTQQLAPKNKLRASKSHNYAAQIEASQAGSAT